MLCVLVADEQVDEVVLDEMLQQDNDEIDEMQLMVVIQ